ncbi:fibroblast growth factor 1 isoform X3 [Passer montanus]|uniref:fibroblast growth factor 1 isoform X3 n=1 Tax=Passer montanus TaxID=9160 RepID=UPI0019621D61|nr:fibroblast growth factor 1 isoform X3 [Passer montanus]
MSWAAGRGRKGQEGRCCPGSGGLPAAGRGRKGQEGRCCPGSGGFAAAAAAPAPPVPGGAAGGRPPGGWVRPASPSFPRILPPRGSSSSSSASPLAPSRSSPRPREPQPERRAAAARPRSGCGMAEGEISTFSALTERFDLPAGSYKKPKLLYCSNGGHFLRILPDGTVDGTRDRSDLHRKEAACEMGTITGKSWNLQVTVTAATGFSVSPFSILHALDKSSCSRQLGGMLWIRGLQSAHPWRSSQNTSSYVTP